VPQITGVRDDEGTRIRALPRAYRLEGAPHVVFKSQRGQLVGGIPPRESFRALGP
jgi:thioredoxin-related protein